MTRGMEALLRKSICAASGLLLLAGAGLGVWAFAEPDEDLSVSDPKPAPASKPPEQAPASPPWDPLARARMTRTIAPKPPSAQKPQTPALDTLIRVRGIMDFGDPKTNEAIIEDLKSGKSRSYHMGERVHGLDAVITQIDSGVTFTYDGKTVRLEMRGNERSEGRPMASPGSDVRTAGSGDLPVIP